MTCQRLAELVREYLAAADHCQRLARQRSEASGHRRDVLQGGLEHAISERDQLRRLVAEAVAEVEAAALRGPRDL